MEYRRKGVSRLELLLELSLAFDDVPLCFCKTFPLFSLAFSFDFTELPSPQR
jgi:hypothetical protein